jgi:hypothetical protein
MSPEFTIEELREFASTLADMAERDAKIVDESGMSPRIVKKAQQQARKVRAMAEIVGVEPPDRPSPITLALLDTSLEPNDYKAWFIHLTKLDLPRLHLYRDWFTKQFKVLQERNIHMDMAVKEGKHPSWAEFGTMWAATAKALLDKEDNVFVNFQGGMRTDPIEKVTDSMEWNGDMVGLYKQEVFTISKWSEGQHYYVNSSVRELNTQKYNTMESALDKCRAINPTATIVEKRVQVPL